MSADLVGRFPSAKRDKAQSLERKISAIESLINGRFHAEAARQLDASFAEALGDPNILSTRAGLLIATNLHIIKVRIFEIQRQVADAGAECLGTTASESRHSNVAMRETLRR
ncbi:hypothetical protein [Caballeronia sp. ATUFL_M2_KS44]|uniref:hypothetical protein n=1 Tax=Caballeronia sp. ATUFL_M2_KS44 TaxID=2921767 RepID=UPI0020295AD0|nr:hypothetical protein [Caballeronia sp. ATUFL_M2_KS44]